MLHLGVKAHWRDASAMADVARDHGATHLEVHMAPRDAATDRERVLDAFRPLGGEFRLVMHQPFWHEPPGAEAFFVNPGARDEAWRHRSVQALAESLRIAEALDVEGFIVHPGGVHLADRWPAGTPDQTLRSLRELRDLTRVPLWVENMPWFYGLPDGRLGESPYGRAPPDLQPLVDAADGLCLDTCHAHLSDPHAPGLHHANALVDAFRARIRHVHVAGAAHRPADPRSGEGIPLREGDAPVPDLADALARLPTGVAVVPEIEHGFEQNGQGFRDALRTLRDARPDLWSTRRGPGSKKP